MIESLSIAKVASYTDAPEKLTGLKELNFIFGSNGTGKSTIGRLIASPVAFPYCSIIWKGGTPLETLVYNQDFIDRNFKPSEALRGVFTLGEKNIDTLNTIELLVEERETLIKKIESWNEALQNNNGDGGKRKELTELDAAFRDKCWTQKIKHDSKFQVAFEGGRASAEKFKSKILENVDNTSDLHSLEVLIKRAATIFGPSPVHEHELKNIDSTDVLANEKNPILKKRVIGKDDVDIAAMIYKLGSSDWVKEGKGYFEQSDNVCPFCQQATNAAFAKSLNEYFDESFDKDIRAIESLSITYNSDANRLLEQVDLLIATPSRFLNLERLTEERDRLNSKLIINKQRIASKQKESSQLVELESLASTLSAISNLIAAANLLIADHNLMVRNLSTEKQTLTSQIWRLVVEEIKADIDTYKTSRGNLEKAINGLSEQINEATRALNEIKEKIRGLERTTTSVQPTVDAINQLLLSFGFHGFSISHVPDTTHYKLVREDGSEAMKTLSEGEKTFVTFLYFFQLIKGSDTESGVTSNRVVVFDDPVSSLDSDILFIVGSLIKGLFEEIKANKSLIKQVFILTHNVYFHKEVTFRKRRTQGKAFTDETFWIVRKHELASKLERHETNPIKTSYELLWSEIRRTGQSPVTIQNTLRRILENYFKILGDVDSDDICKKFEGKEKYVCKSLFSWVNSGSHSAHDDLFIADGSTVEIYLKVFKEIFDKLDHGAHYRMMMREDEVLNEVV